MLFNSLDFLLFFPIVIGLYFALPYRFRWMMLLAASYYFYMCWKVEYIVLIIVSTLIDYYASLQMSKLPDKKGRKKFLILSLVSNLGILFFFKYFNFFNDSVQQTFDAFNIFYDAPVFDVLLPVGISFYTFQTLSYTIDVYKGDTKAEKHLGIFALYVSFWPQLVAGPIERSNRLLPQFYRKNDFDYKRVVEGFRLILWGFFKKVVIADRLAVYVNEVYNHPDMYEGTPVILATYFFAFQIYCDFSGYSDIAIGTAKVMGYDLMDNFNRPYFSKSIREFWSRWHISLSTWFRDYLYIPLGGNRVVKWRWYYNLFITFLISGLWHGANWTFVIWGALHGAYLVTAIYFASFNRKLGDLVGMYKNITWGKVLSVFITFHLVVLAWIFFRANTVQDAFVLLENFFKIDFSQMGINIFPDKDYKLELAISFAVIGIMLFIHLWERKGKLMHLMHNLNTVVRWSIYVVTLLILIFFGVYGEGQFIYFQF
jgi:alginate O-acetyltransferase complex protein AlgI